MTNLTYTLENNKAIITGVSEPTNTITIPEFIDGYEVVKIGDNAFSYNNFTQINNLVMNTNCDIGSHAFCCNSIVNSVTIPNNCEVGSHAFYCNEIEELSIGYGCIIGERAFASNRISVLTIGTGCNIERFSFHNNKLTNLVLDNCLVGFSAFAKNKLTNLEIIGENSLITKQAFKFNNLVNVEIHEDIEMADCCFNFNLDLVNINSCGVNIPVRQFDGIVTKVIDTSYSQLNDITYKVYTCEYLTSSEYVYVAENNGVFAHGANIQSAITDCEYKSEYININKLDIINRIKSENKITLNDYKKLTGSCHEGCIRFIGENNITGHELNLDEALELIYGHYGYDKLIELLK